MIEQEKVQIDRRALVTELFNIRLQITEIEAGGLAELKQRRLELENILKAVLEVDEGVSFAGVGTVKVSEDIVPTITDWEAVRTYIVATGHFQLLPAKINARAYKDILAVEGGLDGVESTTVRKLSVRKA